MQTLFKTGYIVNFVAASKQSVDFTSEKPEALSGQKLFGKSPHLATIAKMAFHPTPPQLFDEFEEGRITRAQLHAGLDWHARQLVEEIIEAHENPITAWWDNMLAKRAADRWAGRHGVWRVRHILFALSKVPEFEPSSLLWNALHPDVPLHCFFRMRSEPVFRLLQIENRSGILRVRIAHGTSKDGITKEDFVLEHVGNTLEAHRSPVQNKS